MADNPKIALVTGGNKGIGFELVRQLAQAGLHVILTARDPQRGSAAQQKLQDEGYTVDFYPMDVTDESQIHQVAQQVQEKHGRLDILINNAGIYAEEDDAITKVAPEVVRATLETNTIGPLLVTQAMLPLLRGSGAAHVINVSSGYGQLHDMEGGAPAAYKISKTALNAITRIFAGELKRHGISVNAVCPGWVRTDMGGPNASRSVSEAASGIVQLALKRENVPTAGLFRDLKPLNW